MISLFVLTNESTEGYFRPNLCEVAGDIRRSSQPIFDSSHINNRDRRFLRNSLDISPDVSV